MSNVWSNKPLHHEKTWKAFDNIRTFTMILSVLNIFIRVCSIFSHSQGGRGVFPVPNCKGQPGKEMMSIYTL